MELGFSGDQVAESCRFLGELAEKWEPADGLSVLRRLAPRQMRARWNGSARLAQDALDAAQMLRLFYADLTGELLPYPDVSHNDARIGERERLLGHPPTPGISRDDVKRVLISARLFPHGIHVIGEGDTERIVTQGLVEGLLGAGALEELHFTSLAGVGSADRMKTLLETIGRYAARSALLVDGEGQMPHYVDQLTKSGAVEPEDVMMFNSSLEDGNLSPAELIELVAADPPVGRDPATLRLTPGELERYHADRVAKAGADKPSRVACLLTLAQREEHGSVRVSKPELAGAIVERLIGELQDPAWKAYPELFGRRPVLGFIHNRIFEAINRPIPVLTEP